MSPEHLHDVPLTGASDVFSLGMVLYELAAGCHPFESVYAWETAHGIDTRDPLPPSAANRDTPAWLDELIVSMLNRDSALRPAAHEVASGLSRQWRETRQAGLPAHPPETPEQPKTEPERVPAWYWKWMLWTVAASCAAAAAWSLRDLLPHWKLKVVEFTRYPGDEEMPSFSPDGQSVAFAWNGPGQDNFDIYKRPIGSNSIERTIVPPGRPMGDRSPSSGNRRTAVLPAFSLSRRTAARNGRLPTFH